MSARDHAMTLPAAAVRALCAGRARQVRVLLDPQPVLFGYEGDHQFWAWNQACPGSAFSGVRTEAVAGCVAALGGLAFRVGDRLIVDGAPAQLITGARIQLLDDVTEEDAQAQGYADGHLDDAHAPIDLGDGTIVEFHGTYASATGMMMVDLLAPHPEINDYLPVWLIALTVSPEQVPA